MFKLSILIVLFFTQLQCIFSIPDVKENMLMKLKHSRSFINQSEEFLNE
jgi:hypothetical protein